MWFFIQALIVFIVPTLWLGYCMFVLVFRKRLKESARHVKAASVLFLLACYLGIGEGLAGVALKRIERPSSYSEPRNPHFINDWVAYTAPKPEPAPGYRVIVISNSQGFMRERAEGEWCYASLLEDKLRESGYGENAEVLNWSIPGGSAMEYTLLAARSVSHNPDVVILCGYNNDFSEYWNEQPLSSMSSDLVGLAYKQEVRANVPERFLKNIQAFSVGDWLGMNSDLVAWHDWYTRNKEDWTFVSAEPGPRTKLKIFKMAGNVSPELIENFFFAATAEGTNPSLRVVSMPLNQDQFSGFEHAMAFSNAAADVAQKWPMVEVGDATQLLPPEMFYGGRHMRPEGHRLFAEYLFAKLPALGGLRK